jgi:hypothetical protein
MTVNLVIIVDRLTDKRIAHHAHLETSIPTLGLGLLTLAIHALMGSFAQKDQLLEPTALRAHTTTRFAQMLKVVASLAHLETSIPTLGLGPLKHACHAL